ncbi:hypothetical protein PM082_024461 [Marasmius tenuissimus]|nr:hypothetical protein PM082_024461 [Marasmius tenuissimus]
MTTGWLGNVTLTVPLGGKGEGSEGITWRLGAIQPQKMVTINLSQKFDHLRVMH